VSAVCRMTRRRVKERSCLCRIIYLLCMRAAFTLKHPLILRRWSRNKCVLMMQAVVCFCQATAIGSFLAYSRRNSKRTRAVSHWKLLNPCSHRVASGTPNFLFQHISFLPLRQHTLRFQFANGEPTYLCLTLLPTCIAPSKCSATITSQKLVQDTEMILRAARILVTVLSVTYWQQCLSGYTYDHPQFPFTAPDSTSGHTKQVSFPA